jgi:hypothetical protein
MPCKAQTFPEDAKGLLLCSFDRRRLVFNWHWVFMVHDSRRMQKIVSILGSLETWSIWKWPTNTALLLGRRQCDSKSSTGSTNLSIS